MTMNPREYFENWVQEELGEFEEELNELETKLDESGWEPESEYQELIDELRIKLRDTTNKMESLKASGDAEWPKIKKDVEEELSRLGDLLNKTSAFLEKFLLE